jgi:hypothetical protein
MANNIRNGENQRKQAKLKSNNKRQRGMAHLAKKAKSA